MSDEQKEFSLQKWLARYRPQYVRCTLRDNRKEEIEKPKIGRGQWLHMERAIEQLNPTYVELLDEKRRVITAKSLEVEPEETDQSAIPDEIKLLQSMPGTITIEAAVTAMMAAMVKVMPMMTQLIVDAGDASAARHQSAYELAFRENTALVKMCTDMTSQMAKAFLSMVMSVPNQQALTDPNDAMALGFMQTVMQSNGVKPKPNGAKQAQQAPAPTQATIVDTEGESDGD